MLSSSLAVSRCDSVIHAMSGEQDLRKMGGLWSKIENGDDILIAACDLWNFSACWIFQQG
jgi:hypothetical protein